MTKLSKEEFIEQSQKIHNNKYDYSQVEYKNTGIKVKIICPIHGEFYKTPMNHLLGQGCPICSRLNKKMTTEEFIEKARKIHGNKYDYSKVKYTDYHSEVCVICPVHGEFWITPSLHISQKCGCPKCSKYKKLTTEEFIERARKVHGDKYDYSKTEYVNSSTKVCIICPIHGEFWMTPNAHINAKHNCPKCSHPSYKKEREDFIREAKEVHGNKYDYSKVEYIDNKTKVCIICPEHGEFWQTPHSHLSGVGCPICSKCRNLNETALYEFINSHISERVVREKHLPWLGMKTLDIYIPKHNIAIEYQGRQHFMPLDFFGGEKSYQETIKRDELKFNLCKTNKVHLFYFSKEKDLPNTYFDKIYTNENELLEKIIQIIDKD